MNNLKHHSVLICFLTILFACSNNNSEIHKKISTKNFDDIIQDVEFAITENNFRVVNRLNIGESIQERKEKKFPKNEIILFCNLSLAEEMLILEPDYINFCPYKITINEQNNETFIATRLMPINTGSTKLNNFALKMNNILVKMVEYAASEDPFILDLDK